MSNYDAEIQAFIRDMFEENYELLRLEGAGGLSPDAKETALQQVLLYWRKMREVAESITDTEVKLSLPGQETLEGRGFTIQGVVDIVREKGRTIMYDIKSHDAEYVRANRELYEKQLNVYAYIWQELRGQPLDEAAVIATDFPESIKEALSSRDGERLAQALEKWDPLVPIPFDMASVQATTKEFADVVDAIEAREFAPRPAEDLGERMHGSETLFVTRVCGNCDARFSCSSYRRYALRGRGRVERRFREYFSNLGTDVAQDDWRTVNLNAARDAAELVRDFGR
jgi:hypothetical protein